KPDTAVTRAKKLTLQDKVHLLVGGVLATEGYAIAPVSTNDKTVYIAPVAAADDLTQRDFAKNPYFIRTGWTSSQPHHALGQWACDQGYKTIVTIAADYAFGHEATGGFQKGFEDCGGKIVQTIWPPLGAKDSEPFIKAMAALKIDAVRGPVAFDDMRNPLHNIYIKKVEKKRLFGYDKDELWNTVIKTYPNVSQFWTYGKDAFLKQPVYSRDFPP